MLDRDEYDEACLCEHLLTEQVMTHTFLGFCLSQLCMFLHTANRLWRLGAWREGQLHSDTCKEVGRRKQKRGQKNKGSSKRHRTRNRKKRQIANEKRAKMSRETREGRRKVQKIEEEKKRKSGGEEKGEVEVSNSTAAAEQHNTPVTTMSHLLEIQRLPQADRGPSWLS